MQEHKKLDPLCERHWRWGRDAASTSSEGYVVGFPRHLDVHPWEEEGNERQPTMMALRKYITGLLPTTISVSNCSSFDFFILNLTTRLIQKNYIEISITF